MLIVFSVIIENTKEDEYIVYYYLLFHLLTECLILGAYINYFQSTSFYSTASEYFSSINIKFIDT